MADARPGQGVNLHTRIGPAHPSRACGWLLKKTLLNQGGVLSRPETLEVRLRLRPLLKILISSTGGQQSCLTRPIIKDPRSPRSLTTRTVVSQLSSLDQPLSGKVPRAFGWPPQRGLPLAAPEMKWCDWGRFSGGMAGTVVLVRVQNGFDRSARSRLVSSQRLITSGKGGGSLCCSSRR